MTILRISGAVGALAAAALCVASPATAAPATGAYTATVTQAFPPDIVSVGQTMDVMLASDACGPGCLSFITSSDTAWFGELRLQGPSYTGVLTNAIVAGDCTGIIDEPGTVLTINCMPNESVTYALTPN